MKSRMTKELIDAVCAVTDAITEKPRWSLARIEEEMNILSEKNFFEWEAPHRKAYEASNNISNSSFMVSIEIKARIALAMLGPDRVDPVDRLDDEILQIIKRKGPRVFNMDYWHAFIEGGSRSQDAPFNDDGVEADAKCGTTHCRAGWATALSKRGKRLEDVFEVEVAGAIIYLRSVGYVPDFYAGQRAAMRDMRRQAARQREEG